MVQPSQTGVYIECSYQYVLCIMSGLSTLEIGNLYKLEYSTDNCMRPQISIIALADVREVVDLELLLSMMLML